MTTFRNEPITRPNTAQIAMTTSYSYRMRPSRTRRGRGPRPPPSQHDLLGHDPIRAYQPPSVVVVPMDVMMALVQVASELAWVLKLAGVSVEPLTLP